MLTNFSNLLGFLSLSHPPNSLRRGRSMAVRQQKKLLASWLWFPKAKSLRECHRQSIWKNQEGRLIPLRGQERVPSTGNRGGWGGKNARAEKSTGSSFCPLKDAEHGTWHLSISYFLGLLMSHNYIQLHTTTAITIHFFSYLVDADAIFHGTTNLELGSLLECLRPNKTLYKTLPKYHF